MATIWALKARIWVSGARIWVLRSRIWNPIPESGSQGQRFGFVRPKWGYSKPKLEYQKSEAKSISPKPWSLVQNIGFLARFGSLCMDLGHFVGFEPQKRKCPRDEVWGGMDVCADVQRDSPCVLQLPVCNYLIHFLLLNIFQTKPASKFFTNLLRNSENNLLFVVLYICTPINSTPKAVSGQQYLCPG